jgi:hypothetical protein
MQNSPELIQSILKNIQRYVDTKKYIDVHEFQYDRPIKFKKRISPYFFKSYFKIYNDVENSYYGHSDIAMFCLYVLLYEEKIIIGNL